MPQLTSIIPGDRAYLVRETSPGIWVDRSFDPSQLGLPVYTQVTLIEPTAIGTLDTVVVEVVSAPASTQIIIPKVATISFLAWTTPWTSSSLLFGSSSLLNNSRYCLSAPSENAGDTAWAFPFHAGQLTAVLAGDGLSVKALANLTGGDASFQITVRYSLIDA